MIKERYDNAFPDGIKGIETKEAERTTQAWRGSTYFLPCDNEESRRFVRSSTR